MPDPLLDPAPPSAGQPGHSELPAVPPAGSELRPAAASELGASVATPEPAPSIEVMQKRVADTQAAYTRGQQELSDLKAQNASLAAQAEARKSAPAQVFGAMNQQPLGPQDFGMGQNYLDPGQNMAPIQPNVVAVMGALLGDSQIQIEMLKVVKDLGFEPSDAQQKAIRDYCNAVGSVDVKSAAKVVLHDEIIQRATDAAKKSVLAEVRQSSEAAVPTPAGQSGQPRRQYGDSAQEYRRLFEDAKSQGRL